MEGNLKLGIFIFLTILSAIISFGTIMYIIYFSRHLCCSEEYIEVSPVIIDEEEIGLLLDNDLENGIN